MPFVYRFTYLFALFSCVTLSASIAQTVVSDVVTLKNGWILRGTLLPARPDSSVVIDTRDGNRFVFSRAEVQTVGRDTPRTKGYGLYVELGPLAARNTTAQAVTTAAITFHIINGFRFSRGFYAGFGTGVDLYATQTFVPLFASVRGDLSGGSRQSSLARPGLARPGPIPFYFLDGGYGLNATVNNTPGLRYIGGAYTSAGLGIRFPFSRNSSFLLSGGYYLQQSIIEQPDGRTRESADFNRVAIRAGFTF